MVTTIDEEYLSKIHSGQFRQSKIVEYTLVLCIKTWPHLSSYPRDAPGPAPRLLSKHPSKPSQGRGDAQARPRRLLDVLAPEAERRELKHAGQLDGLVPHLVVDAVDADRRNVRAGEEVWCFSGGRLEGEALADKDGRGGGCGEHVDYGGLEACFGGSFRGRGEGNACYGREGVRRNSRRRPRAIFSSVSRMYTCALYERGFSDTDAWPKHLPYKSIATAYLQDQK